MLRNEFIEKYKDNEEMLNVINKVSECMDTTRLNPLHHQTVCEVMYGIQKLYAEPYDIPMDGIYQNLSHLRNIEYVPQSELPGRAAGAYYCFEQDISGERFAKIKVSEQYAKDENLDREIVAHELVHCAVQLYRFKENKILDAYENGFAYSRINEVIVQDTSANILDYYGYKLKKYEGEIRYQGTLANELYIDSNGFGYANISPIAKPLTSVYSKELYQEFFLHENQLHDALNITTNSPQNVLFQIEDKLAKIEVCSSSIEAVNYYAGLYSDCEQILNHRLENDESFTLSEYLKTSQNFRNSSYMVFMDDEPVLLADTFSQNCEIKNFYINYTSHVNIEKEMNPLTRSRDCENFLLAIGGLKDTGRTYSQEDLDKLQWTEISSVGNTREIMCKCGEDQFKITGIKEKGILGVKEIEETDEVIKTSLISSIYNKFKKPEVAEELSFSEKRELSMITGYAKHVLEFEKNPNEIVLYSIIDGQMNGNFINSVKACDFQTLKDNENNNAYHVLAASLNSSSGSFHTMVSAFKPYDVKALLYEENANGFTPIKEAFKNNNIDFLNTLSKTGYSFEGQQGEITGTSVQYMLKSNGKPYLFELIDNNDYDTFERFVNSKTSVMGHAKDGGTLLHHLASGDEFRCLSDKTLQTIKEGDIFSNSTNRNSETALVTLTKYNFDERSFNYLLNDVGVDPNIRDINQRTVLHNLLHQSNRSMANSFDNEEMKFNRCLNELLQKDMDVNVRCKDFVNPQCEITPLQIACGMNCSNPQPLNYELVTELIKAGAHVTDNSMGYFQNPLEYACSTGDIQMMGAFVKAGVPVEVFEDSVYLNISSKLYLEDLSEQYNTNIRIVNEIKNFYDSKTEDLDLMFDPDKTEDLDLIFDPDKTEDLDAMEEIANAREEAAATFELDFE